MSSITNNTTSTFTPSLPSSAPQGATPSSTSSPVAGAVDRFAAGANNVPLSPAPNAVLPLTDNEPTPSAMSASQGEAQITALQSQIVSLQGQMATATPSQAQAIQQQQSALMQQQQQIMAAMNGGSAAPAPAPAPTPTPTPTPSAPTPAPLPTPSDPTSSGTSGAAGSPGTATGTASSGPLSNPTNGVPDGARTDLTLASNAQPPVAQWSSQINAAAQATGVPADLIGAVMYQESSANPAVQGTTNPGNGLTDAGLMQVNPDTQQQMMQQYPQLFQGLSGAAENIMAGAAYLKNQYQAFGSWPKAMRAYNSGPNDPSLKSGNLSASALGDPNYVTKVSAWWRGVSTGQTLPADYNPSEIK